jgi:orotate phosphoribosyltransferase
MKREIQDEVTRLLPARRGHFLLESGHHGELWLDLELLCLRPERIRRHAAQIAALLAAHNLNVEVVCGPLVEGAFVALTVAETLGLPFTYAERFADLSKDALYPVQYRLPHALRDVVRGKRVAIVNDVVNAGSAIRGTFADLQACGAQPVAIGALVVLGQSAAKFAADHKLALEKIASLPNEIWIPAECPLCGRGIPLEDFLNTKAGVA